MQRSAKSWAAIAPMTALEWYGCVACWKASVSQVLATRIKLDSDMKQVWMATPYSAVVARQTVRVMPSTLLEWSAEDAKWLCELITPLLAEVGFSLHVTGCAMVAACNQPLEATPQGYADIDGEQLPDRFPAGRDGGRLVRLLSEIQMLLVAQPSKRRQEAGKSPIHGLWLWAPGSWPADAQSSWPAVASPDPILTTLADGRDASFAIIAADRINEGMAGWRTIPRRWLLAGGGCVVRLERGALPRVSLHPWRPGKLHDFSALTHGLRQISANRP